MIEKRHSRLGIISFSTSIAAGASLITMIVSAGALVLQNSDGVSDDSSLIIIGALGIGSFLLSLISLILGIVGLFQKDRKRLFAILGTVFSLLSMAGFLGLMAIGIFVA